MHLSQSCHCSLMRSSQAAAACEFDPSLLLDHASVTVLQHLLRSENTTSITSVLTDQAGFICSLFAAMTRCSTSQLRICSPNIWSTFYWSSGRREECVCLCVYLCICVCCILIGWIFHHWQSPHRLSTQRVTSEGKLAGSCTGTWFKCTTASSLKHYGDTV